MERPQIQATFEPSANDRRVLGAPDAQERLGVAMQIPDFGAIETLMARDLVVHAPINMVVNRDNVLARLRGGQISCEPNVERNVALSVE